MVLPMVLSAFAADKYVTPTFTDVEKGYYYVYVEEAVENGWIKGYGDGRFGPEDKVTYAQMCVMLTTAFFKDTLDNYSGQKPWYVPYCNAGNDLGLLDGTAIEGKHTSEAEVSKHVSRYDMAQMVYNAMKAANKKMPTNIEIFNARMATADWDAIPRNYRDAVDTCKAAKIINGIDNQGTFAGDGPMTRAQAAIVLVKLSKIETSQEKPVDPDPVDPKPETPTEIERSPFAFKDSSETVGSMMRRLNDEAPNYFEGYLIISLAKMPL